MLATATSKDSSLATARTLANQITEGYHWLEGLLFRTRLNTLGDNVEHSAYQFNTVSSACLWHTKVSAMLAATGCSNISISISIGHQ